MGCDIHIIYEKRDESGAWVAVTPKRLSRDADDPRTYAPDLPFDWRWYGLFGFLAGVRNYSNSPEMPWWNRGFPVGCSPEAARYLESDDFYHSHTHITIAELEAFDYGQSFTDFRTQDNATTTYREFLGEAYFESLQLCKDAGVERVLLRFDS